MNYKFYGLVVGILSLVVACAYLSYTLYSRQMSQMDYWWTVGSLVGSAVALVVLVMKNKKKLHIM